MHCLVRFRNFNIRFPSLRQDFLPAGSEQSASNEAEIQRPDLVTYVVVGSDQ